ncbi:hypothetical protein LF845_10015 [Deferribacterales bacterium Es71-Z0220]|uniref:cobamide remodeling phosphodiesterase CbiR n=1 Tax=Deferrivibrio essentukiensis TaxID=2880922 RepID=UPI001F60E84F|nr:cobamide remodeling phosphodiesterase CbiR [Deferrivibrio essentukiensis]MCB4205292.1 hypothetical protein [Deferrivibrio essentukiensis]
MKKEIKSIGTTSFIIHDSRVVNVKYLQNKVDIVQLLYLDSFNHYDLPDETEIEQLIEAKQELKYYIHMPIDLDLGKERDWDRLIFFAEKLSFLKPERLIVHPVNNKIFFDYLEKFLAKFPATLVENINEVHFFDKVKTKGADICFDVGHAVLKGIDIKEFINTYSSTIKAYHLHGVKDGKDHLSVRYLDKKLLKYLFDFASENDVDIIIEIFGKKDFFDSINYLKEFFRENDYVYNRWD